MAGKGDRRRPYDREKWERGYERTFGEGNDASKVGTAEREPEVTYRGLIDIQVCVPAHWTDDQVERFADREWPAGTTNGWTIRQEGDDMLGGDPERQPCADRDGFVHVMLDL